MISFAMFAMILWLVIDKFTESPQQKKTRKLKEYFWTLMSEHGVLVQKPWLWPLHNGDEGIKLYVVIRDKGQSLFQPWIVINGEVSPHKTVQIVVNTLEKMGYFVEHSKLT